MADAIAKQYRRFHEDYIVYVFDRKRDFDDGYSVEDMAEDTAEAMKRLGLKDACVMGCSQGGMMAQVLAAKHPELVSQLKTYALIIATGSTPVVPAIPGLRGESGANVIVVNDYYKQKDRVTDEVVILGGGLAGCECGIHLGMEGKKVKIVEMGGALAPDANVRHRPLMLKEVDKYCKVYTSHRGIEVRSDGVLAENEKGEQVLIPGTTVICALGQKSTTDQVEKLMNTAPYVRVIGDASRVSTITNAVYWGHHAALDI